MAVDPSDLAHLLRRAGFGATPTELAAYAGLDRAGVVDALLNAPVPPVVKPAPIGDSSVSTYEQWVAATQWWLDRMASTTAPLVEKMTLFWHGHFVTALGKINDMVPLFDQLSLYRSNALGDFRVMTKAMAISPAMLRYLDNDRNVKGAPNENFARELMELFLLGADPGNYSQADVVASARAWTGYGLLPDTWTYAFDAAEHDGGSKTFLGVTGNLSGPDTIDTIFDHVVKGPIMARFIARKLWTFFAYPNPSTDIVNALAGAFSASGYNVAALVRTLFTHDEFYSVRAKQGLVRTPIEWVVATLKATHLASADANPQWYLPDMGQQPFDPPNVAGWKNNAYWISGTAASARANFAGYVAYKAGTAGFLGNTASLTVSDAIDQAFSKFNIDRPSPSTRAALTAWLTSQRAVPYTGWVEPGNLILLMMLSPEMQLA